MTLETGIKALAEAVAVDVKALEGGKVDKVAGKGLSDANFTQTEKTKLTGIATAATKNRADSENADKAHTHTTAQITGLDTTLVSKASKTELTDGLALKVDKAVGKQLSDENYTLIEKNKLLSIQEGAQANTVDSVAGKVGVVVLSKSDIGLSNVDNTSDLSKPISNPTQAALDNKVDKQAGKGLSDTNFTQTEKDKLSSLESSKFVGLFVGESVLPLSGNEGDYANVDGGAGSDVYRVIWDTSDNKWVRVQGVSTELTDAQIKQQYESNPDTNAFTDDEKTKLTSVANGATANRSDSENADKLHTHTTAQVTGLDTTLENKVDKVAGKGLSDTNFTQVEKTKLTSVANGATANRSDSENADKLHTHAISDVTGLDTELGAKASKTELTDGLELKVDKVDGKGLSDTNFTQAEKTQLAGVGDPLRDFVNDYLIARG